MTKFRNLTSAKSIGYGSDILPIRCFADVAKYRQNPMSDPMIGRPLIKMFMLICIFVRHTTTNNIKMFVLICTFVRHTTTNNTKHLFHRSQ